MILSIIIPVYKSEKTINECVDSVLKNAPQDSEIILVDDGSPDNCPKICDDYAKIDNRVKVIHKTNNGVSTSRNSGLDIAQGEYVFFLDSDDYITDGYFEKMFSHKADLVIGNFVAFYSDKTPDFSIDFNSAESISVNDFLSNFPKFFGTVFNFVWGKLYKRDIISDLRFDNTISMGEDLLFNLEYFDSMKNVSLEKDAVVRYRQTTSSLSKAYNEKVFEWYLICYSRLKEFLYKKGAYRENEEFFIKAFMGNVCECVLGIFKSDKSNRKNALKQICNNINAIEFSKKYKPKTFLMFGIWIFIKHKSTFILSAHILVYKNLARLKHIIRRKEK